MNEYDSVVLNAVEEWGSQQSEPDREWCSCNSAELPVRIDQPTIS